MTVAGIVVAAGTGDRLGAERPKALVEVGGRSLVAHAVARLTAGGVEHVVVVHTPGERPAFETACRGGDVAAYVPGGETRPDSVRAGLGAVPDDAPLVAVHDAARALTPAEVIRRTLAAVDGPCVAAAPGLPAADTLKRVDDEGRVLETVDRTGIWRVQTPQVFRTEVLRAAHAGGAVATDDLALVEQAVAAGTLRGEVRLVRGAPEARKITWPADLRVAEALLAATEDQSSTAEEPS